MNQSHTPPPPRDVPDASARGAEREGSSKTTSQHTGMLARAPVRRALGALSARGAHVLRARHPGPSVLALPARPRARSTHASAAEWAETASGLKLRDVKVGEGKEPVPGEFVKVSYVGKLSDSTVFDASSSPVHYRHDRGFVVWGFDEGVCGMKAGGVRELEIPPHLGYGFKRVDGIPPNSTLRFQVELLAVGEEAHPPEPGILDSLQRLLGIK